MLVEPGRGVACVKAVREREGQRSRESLRRHSTPAATRAHAAAATPFLPSIGAQGFRSSVQTSPAEEVVLTTEQDTPADAALSLLTSTPALQERENTKRTRRRKTHPPLAEGIEVMGVATVQKEAVDEGAEGEGGVEGGGDADVSAATTLALQRVHEYQSKKRRKKRREDQKERRALALAQEQRVQQIGVFHQRRSEIYAQNAMLAVVEAHKTVMYRLVCYYFNGEATKEKWWTL